MRTWRSNVALALKASLQARDAPSAAEAVARQFREKFHIVGPLNVHSAAGVFDARVIVAEMSAEASLNSIEPPYIIRVNRKAPEVRKRFSIAHELGHICIFPSPNGIRR